MKHSPRFFSSMSTVRYFDGLLTLASKHSKYWSITPSGLCLFECWLDKVLTEAPNCMTLEIRCGSTILWVQVAANTLLTLSLALPRSTLEEMVLVALIISNRNLCLKKSVHRRTPAPLETLYNHIGSEAKNIVKVSLYAPSSCSSVSPSGSSLALSSWLDKGHLSLPSREINQKNVNHQDRNNAPKMSTEDALEDRDVRAFFKGWTAVAAPFLMACLTDLVMDFAVFAAFFTDNIVLEVTECIDSEEWDKRRYDEDCDNTEFWWLIVQTVMRWYA